MTPLCYLICLGAALTAFVIGLEYGYRLGIRAMSRKLAETFKNERHN